MPIVIMMGLIGSLALLQSGDEISQSFAELPLMITMALLAARFAREGQFGEEVQLLIFEMPVKIAFLIVAVMAALQYYSGYVIQDPSAATTFRKTIGPAYMMLFIIAIEMAIFNFRRR